jgi:predicted metal-binding membrane protein
MALRRDRRVVLASLVLIVVLAWAYLWYDASAMGGMSMGGSVTPVGAPHAIGPAVLAMTFVMWTIMMIGMMVPSAAPTILLYSTIVRKNAERGTILPAVWVFAGGYLLVWTAFSLAATLLQLALAQLGLLTPMMVSAERWLSGLLLIAAGLFQWTPLKQTCLRKCRTPMEFVVTRWRDGTVGALRMGLDHGLYCLGCCWALMLLLFVAGVMNLLWVALLAALVFAEKLLPAGPWTARIAGVVLVAAGVFDHRRHSRTFPIAGILANTTPYHADRCGPSIQAPYRLAVRLFWR